MDRFGRVRGPEPVVGRSQVDEDVEETLEGQQRAVEDQEPVDPSPVVRAVPETPPQDLDDENRRPGRVKRRDVQKPLGRRLPLETPLDGRPAGRELRGRPRPPLLLLLMVLLLMFTMLSFEILEL